MTQTIGQQLKQAREAQRLTFEQVFESTRIRVGYLHALEEDDLSVMPSPVQARGYLRNYAEFLGLNFEQLLEEMRSGKKKADEIIGPADLTGQPAPPPPEPVSDRPITPLPAPVPASVFQAESQPEIISSPEEIPVSKPKTTRRKKTDSSSASEPVAAKRRGRKKTESAMEAVSAAEPQPKIEAEPAAQVEPGSVVEVVETQPEPVPQPDVTENLWQTWLNRIGSVISSRKSSVEPSQPQENLPTAESAEPETRQPENPLADSKESTQIFQEIGAELRTRRELLSLNLDEVERNTRVKAYYLEALENGAMDKLPSTVQTRGMLANYATFIDLDVDALLLRYADALQARHREKNPQKTPRKPGQPITANLPNLTNFIAGDMIFGIGAAILLIGFSIWGVSYVLTLQGEKEVEPTAPSISDVLLASPDPSSFTATPMFETVASLPGEATATIFIPTLNTNVNVQVNLVAVERAYLRVTVDGKVVFDGRTTPGNAYPFEAEEQIEVLAGNGAAIRIVYNGQDLGLLGAFGQVVNSIYLAEEIITPTALPSAVPTSTLTPTATLTPTRTPVPSNTTVPTRTPSP